MSFPVLRIKDLRTQFLTRQTRVNAVDGVSLSVGAGEIVGLVGESGCGKTTLGLSVLRLVPQPGRVVSGSIEVQGRDLLAMDDDEVRRMRGDDIALTSQDPTSSLNPLHTVGGQIKEAMTAQSRHSRKEAAARVVPLMRSVSIPGASARVRDYPHQFSGGMRQRVLMAMGVANHPSLLVADEPTTGLDVTIQTQIVGLLKDLNQSLGTAVLLITHDMGLVASLCRRVVVMYAGRIVEDGPVDQIFEQPQHPYTWSLLRAVPRIDDAPRRRLISISGAPPDLADLPVACTFHPRCEFRKNRCVEEEPPLGEVAPGQQARCWVLMRNVPESNGLRGDGSGEEHLPDPSRRTLGGRRAQPSAEPILRVEDVCKHFPTGARGRPIRAVDGLSLEIRPGETLGLIGESGCGKSTLARVILKLLPATSGRVLLDGQDLTRLKGKKLREARRQVQIIFQDPFLSLNGRMTVGRAIAEPLENFDLARGVDLRRRVSSLMEVVGLNPDLADRYPHQFSGGQRQRIGIARALALRPSLIVCDEPVSSLDVSIQAQIINLLKDLQVEFHLAYLFITHDLSLVRNLANRVAVMYMGKIVETGDTDEVFASAQHPYTQVLLDSVPDPDPRQTRHREPFQLLGEVPSTAEPPSGCRFHTRCPIARVPGVCSVDEPLLERHGGTRQPVACHFAGEAIVSGPWSEQGTRVPS